MNKYNFIYWIFASTAALLGIIATGYGIYLLTLGQNCAEIDCAVGFMSSFIAIPYGLVILFLVGLASAPFKTVSLIGSILSILFGLVNFGLCCITVLWAISSDGAEMVSNTEQVYFIFPLFIFLSGAALLGAGIAGYQRSKQP